MKKKIKLLKIFLYLSLIVLGFVAGIAFSNYKNIPLSEEINLIDVATLVATIFLAVYVPAVLDKHLQTTRDRKELIEKRIVDYQALLRRINMSLQSSTALTAETYLTIKNLLDISGHRLETIISLIKNSKLDSSLNDDIAEIKKLNDQHKNLLLKDSAKNNNFSYPAEIKEEEELYYNKLDELTSLLMLKISDAD